MRRAFLIGWLISSIYVGVAEPAKDVTFDSKAHSVSFTAVSTECGLDIDLEFLFVGPNSDRTYESLFTTLAPVSEIADALDKALIPRGKTIDISRCRFWNVGNEVEITPSISDFIRVDNSNSVFPPIIYTGGERDSNGMAKASINMPAAFFALYNCPQSLLQFDDMLEQSPTYGRFKPRKKIPKGTKVRFTVKWKGHADHKSVTLKLSSTNLLSSVESLKKLSQDAKIEALCEFAPDMTVKCAKNIANVLSMIDSPRIKINGMKKGQPYYKAFLPKEEWRERKERLTQPPEVRFNSDPSSLTVTEIIEDWSDPDTLDPKLNPIEKKFKSYKEAAKEILRIAERPKTIFLYANSELQLKYIFDLVSELDNQSFNIYIFTE